ASRHFDPDSVDAGHAQALDHASAADRADSDDTAVPDSEVRDLDVVRFEHEAGPGVRQVWIQDGREPAGAHDLHAVFAGGDDHVLEVRSHADFDDVACGGRIDRGLDRAEATARPAGVHADRRRPAG